MTITATISATSTEATTVRLSTTSVPADAATSSGTAGLDRDYAWNSSTITIPANSLTGTATLVVYGDEVDEDNETIYVNLSSVTGGEGAVEDGVQTANITIIDDDSAPALNSVTAGVQQNTIAWSAYAGATGYKLYWDTSASVSTSDNLINISDSSSTSYIHSGRTAGTQYFYRLIATTAGGDSALSNELSDTPTAFVGCTSSGAVADNDPDLLVHYAFEGNLEDIEDTNTDNRYDLTNEEGTMQYAQGCAQGQAAYIDSTSGIGVNDNFTSANVGDNFTISLWVAKDGDMVNHSSAINTGFYHEHTPTGNQEKAQIDIDNAGKLRVTSRSPDINPEPKVLFKFST